MIQNKYQVTLTGYQTTIYAFNEREATILAQAQAIREARNYDFVSIVEIKR